MLQALSLSLMLSLGVNRLLTEFTYQWRIQHFPEEGALTPKGERQPIIWSIFPENCMKMKKFWAGGGACPSRPF